MKAGRARILHVITALNRGGAETMLTRLTGALDQERFSQQVVTLVDSGPFREIIRAGGVPVHSLRMSSRVPSITALLRLRAIAKDARADVVHGWMPHGNLAAFVASWSSRVPLLWGMRGSLYDIRYERPTTRLVLRVGARLSHRTTFCAYNSRVAAEQHECIGYARAKRVIIHNGFDTAAFAPDPQARAELRAQLGVGADTLLVGMLARLHDHKDHANAFRAAADVTRAHPQAVFVFAGKGLESGNPILARMLADSGIGDDRVRLLGERSDPARLNAALDLAFLSSYTEGFPNALGEAMSVGVPVVGTDVGDTSELIGDAGDLVPARDWAALSKAIGRLLMLQESARTSLGLRARKRVIERFSIDRIASEYALLYERMLTPTAG